MTQHNEDYTLHSRHYWHRPYDCPAQLQTGARIILCACTWVLCSGFCKI